MPARPRHVRARSPPARQPGRRRRQLRGDSHQRSRSAFGASRGFGSAGLHTGCRRWTSQHAWPGREARGRGYRPRGWPAPRPGRRCRRRGVGMAGGCRVRSRMLCRHETSPGCALSMLHGEDKDGRRGRATTTRTGDDGCALSMLPRRGQGRATRRTTGTRTGDNDKDGRRGQGRATTTRTGDNDKDGRQRRQGRATTTRTGDNDKDRDEEARRGVRTIRGERGRHLAQPDLGRMLG